VFDILYLFGKYTFRNKNDEKLNYRIVINELKDKFDFWKDFEYIMELYYKFGEYTPHEEYENAIKFLNNNIITTMYRPKL